jgi:hypothetical protein
VLISGRKFSIWLTLFTAFCAVILPLSGVLMGHYFKRVSEIVIEKIIEKQRRYRSSGVNNQLV